MKRIVVLIITILPSYVVFADFVTVINDTEMNGWSKAYVTGAITNASLAAKTSGGNPEAFGEWKVQRNAGGGAGSVKVKESEAAGFRLDLHSFYAIYNVESIDSVTVDIDVRYGIGNAIIGMRKYTSEGVFVAEGFVNGTLGNGSSSWSTKTLSFDADSSSFSVNGSDMSFDDEAYYYTFTLVFNSNTSADTSIGQFDNFSVGVNYTAVPEPATTGLLGIAGVCLLLRCWLVR